MKGLSILEKLIMETAQSLRRESTMMNENHNPNESKQLSSSTAWCGPKKGQVERGLCMALRSDRGLTLPWRQAEYRTCWACPLWKDEEEEKKPTKFTRTKPPQGKEK